MRAPVLIVTGPPGIGKTTVASILADGFEPSAVVTGDHFFDFLRRGKIPPWLPESHDQNTHVIDITVGTAAGYARRGWTTVLEGIIGPWFLDEVRRAADGADLSYAVLEAPLEECLTRAEDREARSPADVVAKMHAEFTTAPVRRRHRVTARPDPEVVAREILERFHEGSLRLSR